MKTIADYIGKPPQMYLVGLAIGIKEFSQEGTIGHDQAEMLFALLGMYCASVGITERDAAGLAICDAMKEITKEPVKT